MNHCIICIGSNYHREKNLPIARKALADLFPSIRFASEEETQPLLLTRPELFSNQVASFVCDKSEKEVKKQLKAIEMATGRCPEDERNEKISLDIDLLSINGRILKLADMSKEYIIKGIKELNNNRK